MGIVSNIFIALVLLLVILVGMLLVADLFWAFLTFDELVKYEAGNQPNQWRRHGKPAGFFWRPPASAYVSWAERLRGGLIYPYLALAWLFYSPLWMRADANARRLLRRLRILVAIWNLAFLPPILAILLAPLWASSAS